MSLLDAPGFIKDTNNLLKSLAAAYMPSFSILMDLAIDSSSQDLSILFEIFLLSKTKFITEYLIKDADATLYVPDRLRHG